MKEEGCKIILWTCRSDKQLEEAIKAVKSGLVDGKRTLPKYIDEHDCINCTKNGDISSITLDGNAVSKLDKLN